MLLLMTKPACGLVVHKQGKNKICLAHFNSMASCSVTSMRSISMFAVTGRSGHTLHAGPLLQSALTNVEDDSFDATATVKPGQLSHIMADPELVKQLSGHNPEMSFRGRRASRAPEAHHIHLTPDTDPENTFRRRQKSNRPRVRFEELFAPEEPSNHGDETQNGNVDIGQQQSQEQV